MFLADGYITLVTRGLDPRVHPFRKKMVCRVKPGNDAELASRAIRPESGLRTCTA
jgi:hypothetical protein